MEYEHIDNCVLFNFYPNEFNFCGLFDEDYDLIFIDYKLSKLRKELTYQHEKQHRECCKSGCFCWLQVSVFWTEYHAFRAELDFSLKFGIMVKKTYLKDTFEYLNKLLNKKGSWNKSQKAHYQAIMRVCKLKRFIKLAKEFKFWNKIKGLL